MIGIFDSGVGGLTVAREIISHLPGKQVIYFGDTARLPYGTKGKDFVVKYSQKISKWLIGRRAKIIIIACNTSSAWAADSLKKKFGKTTPIFEMIAPATRSALKATKSKKIAIIGTPGTIRSGVYQKKIKKANKEAEIMAISCPLLVPIVEEGWVDGGITKEILKKYLEPIKDKNIDTLILGCTHYPLLIGAIRENIGSGIEIINPAIALAEEVADFLVKRPEINGKMKNSKNHQFFFSDEPYNLDKISHLCFNYKIKPKINDPF